MRGLRYGGRGAGILDILMARAVSGDSFAQYTLQLKPTPELGVLPKSFAEILLS